MPGKLIFAIIARMLCGNHLKYYNAVPSLQDNLCAIQYQSYNRFYK